MIEIIRKICPSGLSNNPNRKLKSIEYITIHNTGNYSPTANALAHASLLYGGTGGASWHYSVDKDSIYQSFEDTSQCWHAGDGSDGPGNSTSIGIEICVNDKPGFIKACENAAKLTAELLKKHGLGIDRVVQHNKWSGKNCPAEIRLGSWGVTWDSFIAKVKGFMCVQNVVETSVIGQATATMFAAEQWAKMKGATDTFISLAAKYWDYAPHHGNVNPVVAYCQAAKETGYGKFTGVLNESYCNPCGMKTSNGGGDYDQLAHMKFVCWEDGVKAHLDHLALYAGAVSYPKGTTPDPRHFPYLHGTAKTVEALSGKWAPSKTYGDELVRMMSEVKNTAAAVPDWQVDAFNSLIRAGIIKSPDYWKNKLTDKVTIGEMFAVIASIAK